MMTLTPLHLLLLQIAQTLVTVAVAQSVRIRSTSVWTL
jgi:hypothetical protein